MYLHQEIIKSKSNSRVKDFCDLIRDKKYRRTQGKIVCEGAKMLHEALTKAEVYEVLVDEAKVEEFSELLDYASEKGAKIYRAFLSVIEHVSDVKTPQGIVFTCRRSIEPKPYENCRNILIVDNLGDPGNLGTIIRTADAFGIDKLVLGTGTTDFTASKVLRATMGATFALDIIEADLTEEIPKIQKAGFLVIATALSHKSTVLCEDDTKDKTAVIIGNEGSGVSDKVLELCDKQVIIPMSEGTESLNASVAGSIIMWEMSKNK